MITGLILAAGASVRMGRCKALLPYNGITFLEHIAEKLALVCGELIVVTGAHDTEIRAFAAASDVLSQLPVRLITNPFFEKGMFSSLQRGIKEAEASEWLLYHFVDQPGLPEEFYSAFVQQALPGRQMIQPLLNGRRSHPVLMHQSVFPALLHADASLTMRDVLRGLPVERTAWQYEGAGMFADIDTPEDYAKLL